ncbi:MAG: ABC-F family ATP-binding cassette domain-containing protein [Tissierellia bacterium]|nr:ABC-F family ATP-binding cassette domain-containing protein [Tissierellia bacterium]
MAVLMINNLSKSFIYNKILENINFNIEDTDKIGLIGLNGSGKTTLFKIIAGEMPYDEGNIYRQKNIKIGYLEQHTTINSTATVYDECLEVFRELLDMEKEIEELSLQIAKYSETNPDYSNELLEKYSSLSEFFTENNGYAIDSQITGVLYGLGFNREQFEQPVNILSGGQKSRLELAKLLLNNPDILLLDEPTNHLDIPAINWLERFLKDFKGAVLLISHDRYFLDNVVNRIFLLENKTIEVYNTNYTDFIRKRKVDLEVRKNQYENQQKKIEYQRKIVERFMSVGREKLLRQGKSRLKMLEKMESMSVDDIKEQHTANIVFETSLKAGRDIFRISDFEKSFGDKQIFKDVSFDIYNGERVGLIGDNGVGKTTLFKMISGKLPIENGDFYIGSNVEIGYFDQEMSDLNTENEIIDEIWDAYPELDHFQIRSYLARFMFVGDDIFKKIETLSGGEKSRISLLKIMLSNANVLLMDEPTNHLDIDSKEILEDALLDFNGTVFVISHDRYFLNKIATKLIRLTPDGVEEYLGNYDYYIEKTTQIDYEDEEESITKTQLKEMRKKEKDAAKMASKQKRELKVLEEEITGLESEIEKIDLLLSDNEIASDYEKSHELFEKRQTLEDDLNSIYEKWIELQ